MRSGAGTLKVRGDPLARKLRSRLAKKVEAEVKVKAEAEAEGGGKGAETGMEDPPAHDARRATHDATRPIRTGDSLAAKARHLRKKR